MRVGPVWLWRERRLEYEVDGESICRGTRKGGRRGRMAAAAAGVEKEETAAEEEDGERVERSERMRSKL